MAENHTTNITSFRKKWNINIGIVIFGVVFIYLLVTVLMYLTSKHISAYEVREGSILKDNAYTGLAIRNEEVVTAEQSGYINYFVSEASKVGAKTKVYSLSPKQLEFNDTVSTDSQELTAEERDSIYLKTQSFSENYNGSSFNEVYSLRDEISSVLESKSNQSRQAQLDEMVQAGTDGLQVFNAQSDGVILYSTDGYENLTVSDVTADMLSKKNYNSVNIKNNSKVNSGEAIYKLVKYDDWSLVIPLDDKTAKNLADTKSVKVQFTKDQVKERASFQVYSAKNTNLGILTFHTSMVRYAKDRYLDIELILEDESGLKIPKSSVTKKDFYLVPENYLTQGGNSKETGVLIHNDSDDAQFKKVDVYYRDTETGMVYLDPNAFDKNTTLIKPDSTETYKLKKTKSLQGVYNINKGYAVFKQIHILCESDEYYIVESGNSYGLANYDHIALVGKDVRENDIVY